MATITSTTSVPTQAKRAGKGLLLQDDEGVVCACVAVRPAAERAQSSDVARALTTAAALFPPHVSVVGAFAATKEEAQTITSHLKPVHARVVLLTTAHGSSSFVTSTAADATPLKGTGFPRAPTLILPLALLC